MNFNDLIAWHLCRYQLSVFLKDFYNLNYENNNSSKRTKKRQILSGEIEIIKNWNIKKKLYICTPIPPPTPIKRICG